MPQGRLGGAWRARGLTNNRTTVNQGLGRPRGTLKCQQSPVQQTQQGDNTPHRNRTLTAYEPKDPPLVCQSPTRQYIWLPTIEKDEACVKCHTC